MCINFTFNACPIVYASLHVHYCCLLFLVVLSPAAGDAFKRAANIHIELETKHESASNLCEAAQVLKRENPSGKRDRGR